MKKNHMFKILTVFCLVISITAVSSLSAFAYVPVFTLSDVDWENGSDQVYTALYPDRCNPFIPADSVYSIKELNGKTYYTSTRDEEYTGEFDCEIVPPELNVSWDEDCFGLMYEINDVLWFFYCDNDDFTLYIEPYLQNENTSGPVDYFNFYYTLTESCTIKLFNCSYPYTSWKQQYSKYNSDSDLNILQCRKWHDNLVDDNYGFIWTSDKVVNCTSGTDGVFRPYDDTPIIVNDGKTYADMFSSTLTMTPDGEIYLIIGQLTTSFTGQELRFLTTGESCIRIDDLGVVMGGNASYCIAFYEMSIYDNRNYNTDVITLYQNNLFTDDSDSIGSSIKEYDLTAGDYRFRDVVSFAMLDYDVSDLNTFDDYVVTFTFQFMSDSYALFFPGTLEIIDFDGYDSQVKHDEVMDAIDNASDIISGGLSDVVDSVDGAKSELSQEIVDAASDISSSIDDARVDIVESVESAASDIKEGLNDVSDSIDDAGDKITGKLEDTKNGILDGIKSFFIPSEDSMTDIKAEWDELLGNRFGALYEAGGIISDFGEAMNMDSIRARGVKNTIQMPSVTVDLAGTPFTFGGYDVQIVPDGFDFLVNAVKGITSIVCTLAFINALRKKYDKIIGGNSV